MDPRIFAKLSKFTETDKRSFLHLAAKETDIPLAYECIRIGTAIDYKDSAGITALLLASMRIRSSKTIKEIMKTTDKPLPGSKNAHVLSDQFLDDEVARALRIATLLVEQHADVNISVDGETPLSIATEASCWPLVELLLRHGAHASSPGQPDYPVFRSANQRSRYNALIRTTKPSSPRPARPCPCWSGELLKDCHDAKNFPYPPTFLCHCGSKKTYERCCMRRQFRMEERWSPEQDWIMPVEVRNVPLVAQDDEFLAGIAKNEDMLRATAQIPGLLDDLKQNLGGFWQKMLSGLPPETMEPAFLYALGKVDFVPRYVFFYTVLRNFFNHFCSLWTRNISKIEAKKRMDEWNTAVDEYIVQGTDVRDHFDIEFASKIGMNGGALYKECECCRMVEGRDYSGKFKCCSSCKLVSANISACIP